MNDDSFFIGMMPLFSWDKALAFASLNVSTIAALRISGWTFLATLLTFHDQVDTVNPLIRHYCRLYVALLTSKNRLASGSASASSAELVAWVSVSLDPVDSDLVAMLEDGVNGGVRRECSVSLSAGISLPSSTVAEMTASRVHSDGCSLAMHSTLDKCFVSIS